MTPYEEAVRIVSGWVPEEANVNRVDLAEEIRSTIVRMQIVSRQPLDVDVKTASAIVYQIVYFVNDWCQRLRQLEYFKAANELEDCKHKVLELQQRKSPILEVLTKKPAQSAELGFQRSRDDRAMARKAGRR